MTISPVADRKIVDLCAAIERQIKHPWELKQFPFGWLLVVYFDSGVDDHPLREQGGNDSGKCLVPWYDRKHEVVGVGATPQAAARAVLSDGKGARLRAMQICFVGESKRRLAFKHLDTGLMYYPCPGGVFPAARC